MCLVGTGVPHLQQIQQWVRRERIKLGGSLVIENVRELMSWAVGKQIPETATTIEHLETDKMYVVPVHTPIGVVEGVCITCKAEIDWLIQMVNSGTKWVLHIDGKHKMHFGKFLFITYGTHSLNMDTNKRKVTHTFRPLMHTFTKQGESAENISWGLDCLHWLAKRFLGYRCVQIEKERRCVK